jgi:hypothetical protein
MNQDCHGEDPAVAGDVAIHPVLALRNSTRLRRLDDGPNRSLGGGWLEFIWIATPDFAGLAMTNNLCSLGAPPAWRADEATHLESGWIATARACGPRDDKPR